MNGPSDGLTFDTPDDAEWIYVPLLDGIPTAFTYEELINAPVADVNHMRKLRYVFQGNIRDDGTRIFYFDRIE